MYIICLCFFNVNLDLGGGGVSRLWLHKKQLQNKLKWSHAVKLYTNYTEIGLNKVCYLANTSPHKLAPNPLSVLHWARVRVCFIAQEFSFSSVRRWMWYFFFQKLHGLALKKKSKKKLLVEKIKTHYFSVSPAETQISLSSHMGEIKNPAHLKLEAEEQLKRPWHWKERCKDQTHKIIWWKMSFKLFHSSAYLCVCLKIQHWWFHTVVYVILKVELHKHQYMWKLDP